MKNCVAGPYSAKNSYYRNALRAECQPILMPHILSALEGDLMIYSWRLNSQSNVEVMRGGGVEGCGILLTTWGSLRCT